MDSSQMDRAMQIAEAKCPLPSMSPREAAALAFVVSMIIIGTYAVLDEWGPATIAGIVTAALAAVAAFANYRRRWKRYREAWRDAVNLVSRGG